MYFVVKCRRDCRLSTNGPVAQVVERRSEKARVVSANLTATTINGLVAQLAEQGAVNSQVIGSSPILSAICGDIVEMVKTRPFHGRNSGFEPRYRHQICRVG